jgi:hypothetical protein
VRSGAQAEIVLVTLSIPGGRAINVGGDGSITVSDDRNVVADGLSDGHSSARDQGETTYFKFVSAFYYSMYVIIVLKINNSDIQQ